MVMQDAAAGESSRRLSSAPRNQASSPRATAALEGYTGSANSTIQNSGGGGR